MSEPIKFKNPEDGYFTKSVIRIGQFVESDDYDFIGDQDDYDVEVIITKKSNLTELEVGVEYVDNRNPAYNDTILQLIEHDGQSWVVYSFDNGDSQELNVQTEIGFRKDHVVE